MSVYEKLNIFIKVQNNCIDLHETLQMYLMKLTVLVYIMDMKWTKTNFLTQNPHCQLMHISYFK